MKFLTKLGAILLKGIEIYTGFAPLAQASFPGQAGPIQVVSRDLASIAQVITEVEAIGQVLGQPGDKKLLAATPLVTQVVLQSSLLVGHSIDDPALFQQGTRKIADGMADLLNSLKADIPTQNKS